MLFYNGYVRNIDFLKNGRLDSHKNGQKQRNVATCIEEMFFFDLLLIFSKLLSIKKHWFSQKWSIKDTHNSWNQCKVMTWNEKKLLISCFRADFSEIPCHLQWL